MEMEFRFRNNDFGPLFPTFQERVNAMLPADFVAESAASAAAALPEPAVATPHALSSEEVPEIMALVEDEASRQSHELMEAHAGLNAQRVARLLGLLE